MAGEWNPGLDDPKAMDGLPLMASPLTANGEDPDEAALKYFSRQPQPAMGPVQRMQQAVASVPPPSVRMAGATGGAGAALRAAPAPPTTLPPTRPQPDPYQDVDQKALQSEFDMGNQMATTAQQEGQVPDQIKQLEDKSLADAQNKPNPADYKPSFGAKVLRGLRGFGVGALTGGIPGALVGAIEPQDIYGGKAYSAPTDAYDTALRSQQDKVTGNAQSLQNAKDDWARVQDAMKAREAGLTDAGTRMGAVVTGSTDAQKAAADTARIPIDQENADTEKQKAFNLSPEGKLKASQAEIDQRTQYANNQKMPPGYIRNRYILTGEFQPAHDPSAAEIELSGAERAFRQEHGRGPQTLAEWQQITTGMHSDGGSKGSDADLRAASRQAGQRLKDLQDDFDRNSALWTDDQKKDAQQKLDAAKQDYDDLQSKLTTGGGPGKNPAPPSPATHTFSKSAWSRKNPKGDIDGAETEAKARGYQIVP
jgi:hypothetical protein